LVLSHAHEEESREDGEGRPEDEELLAAPLAHAHGERGQGQGQEEAEVHEQEDHGVLVAHRPAGLPPDERRGAEAVRHLEDRPRGGPCRPRQAREDRAHALGPDRPDGRQEGDEEERVEVHEGH
jgi:hypothetical protein